MNEPRVVHLTVPATFEDVRRIDESVVNLLRELGGVSEETIYNVELAVHETCTNIVEHAYAEHSSGKIEVTLTLERQRKPFLLVTLSDIGKPFDPALVGPVDLDIPHEGGYGLFLVEKLMDEVHYERKSGRNIWHLKKAV